MKHFEKLNEDFKTNFLNSKEEKLTNLLVKFISEDAQKLISNPEQLSVFAFEFDTPFGFSYVGYPESSIVSQKYWLDTIIISIEEEEDLETIETIFERNEYFSDDEVWEHQPSGYYIEEWDFFKTMELELFKNAWQKAKTKTQSNYRCFFYEHDVYSGIDADTGKKASADDVIDILNKENFKYTILK